MTRKPYPHPVRAFLRDLLVISAVLGLAALVGGLVAWVQL